MLRFLHRHAAAFTRIVLAIVAMMTVLVAPIVSAKDGRCARGDALVRGLSSFVDRTDGAAEIDSAASDVGAGATGLAGAYGACAASAVVPASGMRMVAPPDVTTGFEARDDVHSRQVRTGIERPPRTA